MPYTVYILYSEQFDRFYIGQTNDIADRIHRHNSGTVVSMALYRPWILYWSGEKPDRKEAMALERKLKNLTKVRLRAFVSKYS